MQEIKKMQVWSLGREYPLKGGCGNPLQYSCQENPMDRGAWRATVPGDHKESDMTEQVTEYTHTHTQLNAKTKLTNLSNNTHLKWKCFSWQKTAPCFLRPGKFMQIFEVQAGSLNTWFELAINDFYKNQNLPYILICEIRMIKTVSLIFFSF